MNRTNSDSGTRAHSHGELPEDLKHAPCLLKRENGIEADCTEEGCTYWRPAGMLGVSEEQSGCAIQYFGLLGDHGKEIARWLLSVKDRVEAEEP